MRIFLFFFTVPPITQQNTSDADEVSGSSIGSQKIDASLEESSQFYFIHIYKTIQTYIVTLIPHGQKTGIFNMN